MTAVAGNQTFVYDPFGNLLQENVTGGSAPTLNITVDPTTNRINMSGFTYDAAGNLTHTPDGRTYAYDTENRTSQGNEGTYYYDANGLRLASVSSDGTTGTWYFRGPNGIELNLVASSWGCGLYSGLYSGFCVSGSAPEKLYFAGRLVMQGDAQSALSMSTVTDRLGSVVQTSSYQGSDYYPYGGNPSNFLPNQTAFATYEAAGTSLLYAQNRFYDSARGRFTTPDPARWSMNLQHPLSFNRYSYVTGDPVNNSDPSGLGQYCWDEKEDGQGEHCVSWPDKDDNLPQANVDTTVSSDGTLVFGTDVNAYQVETDSSDTPLSLSGQDAAEWIAAYLDPMNDLIDDVENAPFIWVNSFISNLPKSYCGGSYKGRIMKSIGSGAGIGAGLGAIGGAAGGWPGVLAGAGLGSVAGAAGGSVSGWIGASVCQAIGAYGPPYVIKVPPPPVKRILPVPHPGRPGASY